MSSPFSGKAGRLAGMWAADMAGNFFNEQQKQLATGKTEALDALGAGRTGALGAIDQGQTAGLASLGAGYDAARPEYQGAIDRFEPWAEAGRGALSTYQGSLGLGGDAARDSAVASFREAPGYQYAVDQATDAVARKASALGALGSGNTMSAISTQAQNMADQGYKDWQGQVRGISDTGLAATGQQANIQQALGNLGAQQGRDEASLYGTAAGQRAGIYTGTGAQEAGLHTNFAQLGNQNIGNLSNTVIGAGTGALLAGQQAAQNKLNLGMGIANLGAGLAGSYFGGMKRAA